MKNRIAVALYDPPSQPAEVWAVYPECSACGAELEDDGDRVEPQLLPCECGEG